MPSEPLNIVILGGSYAGIAVAHTFLDKTNRQLGAFDGAPTYRVLLVSPTTHLYWNIGAPRALVSSSLIDPDDTFLQIEHAFSKYSVDRFRFTQGFATAVDTSAKRVTVELVRNPKENRLSEISKASSSRSNAEALSSSSFRQSSNYPASTVGRTSRSRTIPYHGLIIATGTSAHSPLYSLHGPHTDTLSTLHSFHTKLETAHSIIIVGGGPTGVETAAQLAAYYNYHPHWRAFKMKRLRSNSDIDANALVRANAVLFSTPNKKKENAKRDSANTNSTIAPTVSPRERQIERISKRDSNISGQSQPPPSHLAPPPTIQISQPDPSQPQIPKTITLLTGGALVLPKLPRAVSRKAEKKLRKLGVHILHNLREVGHTENADGTTNCILNNDMTITSDIHISATGVSPNTSFLSGVMLDEQGYVVTQPTLRVQVQGVGGMVYAIGDCANYSKNTTKDVYEAVPVLMQNLRNDLLAHEYKLQTVTSVPVPATSPPPASTETTSDPSSPVGKEKMANPFQRSSLPPRIVRPPSPTPSTQPHSFLALLPKDSSPPLDSSHADTSHPASSESNTIPRRLLLTSEEARAKTAALEDVRLPEQRKVTQLIPITRFDGIGVINGKRVPGWLVYALKGRRYRLSRAKDVVAKGADPYHFT